VLVEKVAVGARQVTIGGESPLLFGILSTNYKETDNPEKNNFKLVRLEKKNLYLHTKNSYL